MGLATAIGGALSLGGAIIGGKSANKNAKRAAQVSADNNAQNVALQRDMYNQNKQVLSPFYQSGYAATNQINALLGLGGTQPAQQQPAPQPNALSQFQGAPNTDINGRPLPAFIRGAMAMVGDPRPAAAGYGVADGQAGMGTPLAATSGFAAGAPAPGQSPIQAQNAAFDNFRNSTGYQFRLNEGMNALNSGYAGAGVLQSGDAMRAAQEYGQNFASGEFGNYMGYLTNQQGVGLAGASALAGVGQNYANNVTTMNTQNAANQANSILSRQNGVANALGAIGGGLFSYGTGAIGGGGMSGRGF